MVLLFSQRAFFGAGLIMLAYTHLIKRDRLPRGNEWRQIFVFSVLGTALYLGLFVLALQTVAAGITALGVALNPLIISILTSLWIKRKVKLGEWVSIGIGIGGVAIATYPLLHTVHATVYGLVLLALAMLAYSIGSVYYTSVTWNLSR